MPRGVKNLEVTGAVGEAIPMRRPPYQDKLPSPKQLQTYMNNVPISATGTIPCPCCQKNIGMPAGLGPHMSSMHPDVDRSNLDMTRFKSENMEIEKAKAEVNGNSDISPVPVKVKGKRKYTKRNYNTQIVPANRVVQPVVIGDEIRVDTVNMNEMQMKARAYDALVGNLCHCPKCGLSLNLIKNALETMSDMTA